MHKLLFGFILITGLIIGVMQYLPPIEISQNVLHSPSLNHWLGTDALGQDIFLKAIYATPTTLLIAIASGLLPVLLALLLGSTAVMGPPWFDRFLLKMTDIFLIIPSIMVLTVFAAFIEPGIWELILLLSMFAWMDDFRILRTEIQREKSRENVKTAHSYGAGSVYVLRIHIWPVLLPLKFALVTQNARQGVLRSAGLAFIGLTDPQMLTWGSMLQEAQEHIYSSAFWWLLLPPLTLLTLVLFTLAKANQFIDQKPVYG